MAPGARGGAVRSRMPVASRLEATEAILDAHHLGHDAQPAEAAVPNLEKRREPKTEQQTAAMHSRDLEPHTKISNQLSPRNQKCLGQECRRGCARLRWREARTKTSSRTRRFDPSLPEHSLQGGGYLRPGWTGCVTLASPVPSHAGHFDFCNDIFSLRLFHMNHSLGTRIDTLTPSSAPALHAPCRYAELNSCCRHPNQWRYRCKSFRLLYQDRLSCPPKRTQSPTLRSRN